jgi:glycosyltransferase involved in cell wall biosynthesis
LREVDSKARVIFVPHVESTATSERSPMMLRTLRTRFRVEEVPSSRFGKIIYDQKVNRLARYLLFPLEEWALFYGTLRRLGTGSAIVFAEGSYFALPSAMAAKLRCVPMVWDNHGNIKSFAAALGKSRSFTTLNVMLERSLAKMVTKILVVSEKDRQDYGRMGFPQSKLVVVPTCADLLSVERGKVAREEAKRRLGVSEGERVVLFFGTLSYGPNLEAARYIAEELAPQVRSRHPEVRFYIAGGGVPKEGLGQEVKALGFVEELNLWISASDLCIAPIWSGVGILTKVIDMMSYGKPTLVSPLALEGMPDLVPELNCLLGKDRADFIAQVLRLLGDDDLAKRISVEGGELIKRSYSCEKVGSQVLAIMTELAAKE